MCSDPTNRVKKEFLSAWMQRSPSARRLSNMSLVGRSAESEGQQVAMGLTELFREHHLELVRLALIMVGNLATAEDVVQDVFERLHRRPYRLDQPDKSLAYARSSVLNACRSVHRRSAVARKHVPRLAVISSDPAADGTASLADRSELAQALRTLPRRQREVLVLRYYLDLDAAEIAATLRIAPSAVRSNCSRGLAALARILGEEDT
jgi:RNA polymerase sigma-70 factor (sigma-E family)